MFSLKYNLSYLLQNWKREVSSAHKVVCLCEGVSRPGSFKDAALKDFRACEDMTSNVFGISLRPTGKGTDSLLPTLNCLARGYWGHITDSFSFTYLL